MKKEKTREDFKTLKEYLDYVDDRMAEQLIARIEVERQYYELEHERQYI